MAKEEKVKVIPEKQMDKFTTKAGDFKVNMSQCAYCANNASADMCEIFGFKPNEYKYNDRECPERIPEPENDEQ